MLKFFAAAFAIAGSVAATDPIIIHLLNRRRFRTVNWAAMDFLREALNRNRRILQLRDLILLTLRVLCVLLFGLALARPYFSQVDLSSIIAYIIGGLALAAAAGAAIITIFSKGRRKAIAATACGLLAAASLWNFFDMVRHSADASSASFSSRQPVHAVLVIDNSLSMAYEGLDGTLLDLARTKAREFVDDLPTESRTTIIPLCGSETGFSIDAYRTKQDAREALERIEVVDRAGSAVQAIELAAEACQQVPELATKRVVFLSDQQLSSWPADSLGPALENLPELQVVQVAAETPANVWISDFRIQDGIADIETPTIFLASVSYEGPVPLPDVQIALTVDGVDVAGQAIELEPGQTRELEFKYLIDVPADPGRPSYVTASVVVETASVEGDGLKNDNHRHLTVPVVAGLPVVFVDQYGPDEDPDQDQIGETYRFRRLLAPRTSRSEFQRQLIQIRHTTIDKLDIPTLEDARLVVIAGIDQPGKSVKLLREYVEQGGQLVIAAGADFDALEWTNAAWLKGAGILPLPLQPEPVGETPEESVTTLEPFYLNFSTMQHDFFRIENEPNEVLEDLYRLPIFFKTVAVNSENEVVEKMIDAETKRIEDNRKFLAESDERFEKWKELEKDGEFTEKEEALRIADEQRRKQIQPSWLLWQPEQTNDDQSPTARNIASRSRPLILASYAGNNLPFMVERNIGLGRVLMMTSGAYSSWNTLTTTNAILMYDRIFRSMLEQTMPQRNFEAGERITIPAMKGERLQYTLHRPSGYEESLAVEAFGGDKYGVAIRNAFLNGHYQVAANRVDLQQASLSGEKIVEFPMSVNGPVVESELASLDSFGLKERMGEANYRWVERDEPISLEGAQIQGRDIWRFLIKIVLAFLLIEMAILAWPSFKGQYLKEATT